MLHTSSKNKLARLIIFLCLTLLFFCGATVAEDTASTPVEASLPANSASSRAQITEDFITLMESDEELMRLE